eukprot:46240-Rhodomonas_salina.2
MWLLRVQSADDASVDPALRFENPACGFGSKRAVSEFSSRFRARICLANLPQEVPKQQHVMRFAQFCQRKDPHS